MKNKKVIVTHEDVQRALAAFRKQGGTITRLPDQIQTDHTVIGQKYSTVETDLSALGVLDDSGAKRMSALLNA